MKYKLLFILCTLFFTGCVIHKEIHITIKASSDIKIDSAIYGSDLEDIKPSLEIPLLP